MTHSQSDDHFGLTVAQMHEQLGQIVDQGQGENKLRIAYNPGHSTMGGAPSLALGKPHVGFDWDSGKVFIMTEKPVGLVDEAIQKKLRRLENHHLHLLRLLEGKDNELTPEERLKTAAEWVKNAIATKDEPDAQIARPRNR